MGAGIAESREGFRRALGLHRAGKLPEAALLYRSLIAAGEPCAVDARINLGAILDQEGRHEEALGEYRQALELGEGNPLALNNMGNSLMKLGRFGEAAQRFRLALLQSPECLEARLALGAALQRGGDAPGAIACFRDMLQLDPSCAEAHWNLSLALLLSGAFREGWQEYQWRWRRDSFTSPGRGFREPLWDGAPLAGRRLLVHAEQGFGDTIQFIRYLPMLAAAGGTVLAECQSASLRPLLERIPGVGAVFVMGEELPPFDLQVPLLSLPHLFGTTLENLPARVPYLSADPERLAAWRQRMGALDGVRVGLAWAGKPVPDPFRSSTLEALAPLGGIPGVTFYCLQLGEGAAGAGAPGLELVDLTAEISDFGDTAALISHLDLVISVDTSVAHLAGALGKPVWLLLPKAGDWRWLLEREDSPWYPSMRIFRQERQGEWGSVVERLSGELDAAVWPLLEKAAAREPFNGWRFHLCGEFLAAKGRHREATVRFSKAAQLIPASWQPHHALGVSLQQMGRVAEARRSFEAAVATGADLAPLHEALGITLQLQGELEGAIDCYRKALNLDPASHKSRFNLATACRESGRFAEALHGFAELVRLCPGHADAHWNLALLLLLTGEFAAGWREFAWRFRKSEQAPVPRWQDHPRWDGSPLDGRSVLLYGEQGLGDTLQFVRYAPLVAERGGRVLVELQSRALLSLVARVAGVSGVLVAGERPPEFDLQASLLDLPGIFATGPGSIPDAVPYLQLAGAPLPLPDLIARDGSFKVGVVWGGNPAHQNDANRSIGVAHLAPLAGVPGVSFYSLQLGEGALQADGSSPLQLRDLAPGIGDFSDTAAYASQLDLIVTADTSVAHLCGGLALPVWVLIPYLPDWRWLLEREDSPWYPTMRLFRQQSPGDWEGVVLRLREALALAASGEGAGAAAKAQRTLGLTLVGEGRFAEAAREFQRATAGYPRDVELLNQLGCALDNAGRHLEAIDCYRRALRLDPGLMAAQYNMGNSLQALGRTEEAIDCYRRALALDPSLAQGWHNLGFSLREAGGLDEAQLALERAVTLRPDYLEARHNLGELQHARGDLDAAVESFREILALDPRQLPSWNGLGIALQAQERLEQAVDCYLTALSIKPDYLHALNNLGAASRALGMPERAVHCYRSVLALDPDYADARWNLALVELLLGRFREGWQGYEWRFRKVDPIPTRSFPQPPWDGSPLKGRSILLHAEQGFGDTIQFVRYAGALAATGAVVLVEGQSDAIAPLLTRVPGITRVLVRGEPLPEFEVHASLMSLPHLCGTRLETVPARIPYLSAEPGAAELWRARLAGPKLRVGLVWAGRKSYKDDAKRSLNLKLFAPLAGIAGVRLYSLQVGEGAEQSASPPPGLELTDLGGEIRSFADSAAIVANLDLVISADTAVAHLAGALGKAVWILLPAACDWRWLLDRDDSPWYPSARLFRQSRRGDWTEVLQRVARQLAQLAG
ncbi:MAG: hypothetical protein A2075_21610 [Geobacteraceae bacterium GWC2_58_44]|nr:MAG: hypothetical protein A2075_21610 [Geobacteraceae bacterium GWC2_58_44]